MICEKEINLFSFLKEIKKWNKTINLISSHDLNFLFSRHYLDSRALFDKIPPHSRIIDIGSGNGFPAIPLAIFRPDIEVISVEAQQKKAVFLSNCQQMLSLNNYQVINTRIEDLSAVYRNSFSFITARAFSDINNIILLTKIYAQKICNYIIFNSLHNIDISTVQTRFKLVINIVQEYVYYLPDNIKRTLTHFSAEKKSV